MQYLKHLVAILLLVGAMEGRAYADPLTIDPFYTFNQSPLVQIYGLPAAESATVQPVGKALGLLALDIANNSYDWDTAQEKLTLDGESERMTLALRYGIARGMEVGVDVPVVAYSGGIFDGFIEEWHRVFGLPQGNRTETKEDHLLFQYDKNGQERLRMDNSTVRIGDVRVSGGWQLYRDGSANPKALALRASLKLPTGSSSRLTGSGSTDLALWLSGSSDYPLSWGHATVFGAVGGMAMTDGDVLKDQRENLVGFGSLGAGWSPMEKFALKAELSSHTAFYKDSDMKPLSSPAVVLIFGGTYAFSPATALDIALAEDLNVNASPDVALHLGLSHRF